MTKYSISSGGVSVFAAMAIVAVANATESGGVANEVPRECWIDSQAIGTPDVLRSQIERFEKLEPICAGSGIYESRLGDLYSLTGQLDESERLIKSALSQRTEFEKELLASLAKTQLMSRNFEGALSTAKSLVSDYPSWAGAYMSLGSIFMEMREFEKAIPVLEKANSLEEVGGTNLMLTMAYYMAGEYQQSALSLQKAVQQDPAGLKHTDAICAGSLSLLRIGHFDAGLQLLQKHVELVPSARDLPNVQTVMKHYQAAANQKRE